MRSPWASVVLAAILASSLLSRADDPLKRIQKAIEQSTLDQGGTHPFHLKAVLAPSLASDNASGRTGEVEFWWKAPNQYRREVRSLEFNQVQVVDGSHIWQKNEGDYFPEWLRETADALVRPVVLSPQLVEQMRGAEVRRLMGGTYLSWTIMSSNGQVQKGMGAGISIRDDTGLLFTADGFGWGGLFKDYAKFHNRMVARTVSVGSPEVTAKIVTLEDLGSVPAGWFDPDAPDGDAQPVNTVLMDEQSARANLLPAQDVPWPALKDGPLQGVLTTEILIDRFGKVREIGTVVSDNPGLSASARQRIAAMRFTPFAIDGQPVQVLSRITLAFNTTRPAGTETFDSARNYFERARHFDFPAGGAGFPYLLKADFQARSSAGAVDTGHYEDTWLAPDKWRREASFASSHVVRSRSGNKLYQLEQGPDAKLLLLVFNLLEPIPAIDTFVESDWRMQSDSLSGVPAVRVLSGYQSPDGKLDPEHARAFWFDANGNLVQNYLFGLEARRSDFQDYQRVHVARRIDVFHDSAPVLQLRITDLAGAEDALPKNAFELKGHEISRQFTSEAR